MCCSHCFTSCSCAFTVATDVLADTAFSWAVRALGNGFNRMIVTDLARLEPYVIKHLERLVLAPAAAGRIGAKPNELDGEHRAADTPTDSPATHTPIPHMVTAFNGFLRFSEDARDDQLGASLASDPDWTAKLDLTGGEEADWQPTADISSSTPTGERATGPDWARVRKARKPEAVMAVAEEEGEEEQPAREQPRRNRGGSRSAAPVASQAGGEGRAAPQPQVVANSPTRASGGSLSAPSPPPELKHRPSPVMTGLSGSEEPGPRRRSAGMPSPSAPPPPAASPAISGARRYDFKQGGEEEGRRLRAGHRRQQEWCRGRRGGVRGPTTGPTTKRSGTWRRRRWRRWPWCHVGGGGTGAASARTEAAPPLDCEVVLDSGMAAWEEKQ